MKTLLFSLIAACVATFASATTQTLEFNSGITKNIDVTTFTTSTLGGTLTVSALKDLDLGTDGQIRIAANYGMGVTSNPKGNRIGTQGDTTEAFHLIFEQTVRLIGVTTHDNAAFGEVITWNTGAGGNAIDLVQTNTGNNTTFDFTLGTGLVGSEFFMTVAGGTGTFLQGIKISAVPVPGTMLLTGSALLGLLTLRGRQDKPLRTGNT